LLKKVRKIVRKIGKASRAKGPKANQLKAGYQELLKLAKELVGRARQLLRSVGFSPERPDFTLDKVKSGLATVTIPEEEILHYVILTEKVCDNARRRVVQGETLANEDKIFSIYEPHTELIKRGKQPNPIQFGHNVLVIEDAAGFVVDFRVVANGVLDQDLVIPVMKELQERFRGKIKSASFDRAFHTPDNQRNLAEIVKTPCIPAKGEDKGRQQQKEGTVAFRQARQHHPGVESAIGALQAGNGLKRCRDRSKKGYERYVALGILGRNLQTLGKLLLAKDQANCEAAKSKRKRAAG
jgi:transposase, IS5 family